MGVTHQRVDRIRLGALRNQNARYSRPVSSPRQSGPNDSLSNQAGNDLAAVAKELDLRREELDRLFRTAAHDLRAPLRSIEAFTRLAIETDGPEAADHLDRALNAVDRMGRLLDSLLDYSDAGGRPFEFSPNPLVEVVRAALADLSVDIEESRAVIDVGPLPVVHCDPVQLQRVFTNILSNSLRYTSKSEPHIVVRAFEEPDRILVTVTDDGDGFAPELSEAVFQPFRRGSAKGNGQGLGLAICRRITEIHGGSIRADSEPSQGTTITMTLPTNTAPAD